MSAYQVRESQRALAAKVAENLEEGGILLAEAGTGTGKTFAYLLPALLSGEKVLVSTATKNLQEQIFTRDLPLVRKVLNSTARVALLKGRRNYLCPHHLHQLQQHGELDAKGRRELALVADFATRTRDGDLVGLDGIAEDAPIRQAITSTADNCLGRDCEFFEECFVQKARQKAKEADVVIVNHHLLLADFALKSDGFAEILPDIDAFIIDEAHHLPQTAINFLGERLSSRQMQLFMQEARTAQLEEAPDDVALQRAVDALAEPLQRALKSVARAEEYRVDDFALPELQAFFAALRDWAKALQTAGELLGKAAARGKLLANLAERGEKLRALLPLFLDDAEKATAESEAEDKEKDRQARWLDASARGFSLNLVPVNAAGRFAAWIRQSEASWTFLSATLTVDHDFGHFARELGLREYESIQLDSPFDYRRQSLLYHPQGLPQPNDSDYTDALMDAVLPVLECSGGRAFLLFTSYRAMYQAERALRDAPYTFFVQGQAPKERLLADFIAARRGILLATASFWEGVDVRGDRLVCVVIDKLPFAAPNDPVSKVRHRHLQEKGLSPFLHDTLPQAVITLKQGVGRLIRDVSDYGVLVIGDPRLTQKGYGKIFLDSLPRMTRTTDLAVVKRFFAYHETDTNP
ncbi:MAG: ATP-dependent DNA helicase [Cardiobacteriaceae bacterium]|nr:ATP-dependent DNA helicase [Cardiobacteriaceae bacterium]